MKLGPNIAQNGTVDNAFDLDSKNPLTNAKITEFKDLVLGNAEPPTYIQPVVSLNNISGVYEVGSNVNLSLAASFTQNDAGALQSVSILKNNATISSTATASDSILNGQPGSIAYKANSVYAEGETKTNEYGELDPTGKILAGNKDSAVRNVVFRFKTFAGSTATSITDGRTLTGRFETDKDFNITANQKIITVFVPYTLSLSVAKNLDTNENLLADFVETAVQVADANGTLQNYKKYEYSKAVALNATVNIKLA